MIDIGKLGMSLVGPVCDVAWNHSYHMVALAGFGDEYPILVFVNKVEDSTDINKFIERIRTFEEKANEDVPTSPEGKRRFFVIRSNFI
jgi:hypothetical protein